MNTKTQPVASEPSSGGRAKAIQVIGELISDYQVRSQYGAELHKLASDAIALLSSDAKPASELTGIMTLEKVNEVNESLWAELDAIKEKTGYNEYCREKKAESVGHWTLLGYLLNLKHRAEASEPVAVPQESQVESLRRQIREVAEAAYKTPGVAVTMP